MSWSHYITPELNSNFDYLARVMLGLELREVLDVVRDDIPYPDIIKLSLLDAA